jgi:hypothetical protein
MSIILKQSTASQEILLGPFVDDADGDTQMTALTIANTDIKVWKTGATTLANKTSGGATHISGGLYYTVLDATDTDTLGPLEVHVHMADALPVRRECLVLAANVYDSLVAASDKLQVDAVEVSSDTTTADNLQTAFASTIAELAAVPAANAPLWTAIKWLFLKSRNKITQTAVTQTEFAADGTTTVSTSTVSDAAGTFTRGEHS